MLMNIDAFFYANPVFRHEDFVAWKTRQRALKAISINTSIQHYIKSGKLIRIRRELYAVEKMRMSSHLKLLVISKNRY